MTKTVSYSLYKGIILVTFLLFFSCINLYPQWVKIKDIPSEYQGKSHLLDIYFLPSNPDLGWACGYHGMFMRTTDRGKTWIDSKINDSLYLSQFESVHFVNEKVGFVLDASGYMYKSTDGGVSWNVHDPAGINNNFWGLHFYNEKVGCALGGVTCNDSGGKMYIKMTWDGGNSWTDIIVRPHANTKFSDPLLHNAQGGGYAISSGMLWESTNGRDWKPIDFTGGYDWHEEITHINGSFCIPVSMGCNGTHNGKGGVRMKTKKHDWKFFNTGHSMYGSFLLDEQRAWVCGSEEALFYTDDGGLTWEEQNCGIYTGESLDDFWFIDDTTGFVVGNGIYKWTPLDTVPPVILPDSAVCENGQIDVYFEDEPDHVLWFVNDNIYASGVPLITVNAGDEVYAYLEYWDRPFCGYSKHYKVKTAPAPQPEIEGGDTLWLCENDSVRLRSVREYEKYEWSTYETTRDIYVDTPGEYILSVVDSNGCQNSKSVEVVKAPEVEVNIEFDKSVICIDELMEIRLTGDVHDAYNIRWNYLDSLGNNIEFGKDSTSVHITQMGSYFAFYETQWGCEEETDTLMLNVILDSNSYDYKFTTDSKEESYEDTHYPKLVCRTLTIENITQNNQELTNAYFQDNIEFTVPPGQFPILFEPWGKADVKVCFTAYGLDVRRDTLIIEDKCWNHRIPMRVESLGNDYSATGECDIKLDFSTKGIDTKYIAFFDTPYPNPTNDDLFINSIGKIEDIQNAKISILNSAGRQQKFEYELVQTTDKSAILKISHNLLSGNYILHIQSGDNHYTYNFVIER